MLAFFKQFSEKRSSWLLLALSSLALELTALYFQYGMGLQPCVLCVYERLAMIGLFFAGIIGLLAPHSPIIRLIALALGLFSGIKGLMISIRHLDLQMNPAPWKQCEFLPNFPETLPFHQWFPSIFNPTGTCDNSQWSLFGITMVQWLVAIFAVYVIVLVVILIAQVKKTRRQRRLFN
ncbi:disulfide bond formation protein DsbB [Rodentibacter heidelbergensis]|uniref:Disulfide bond formation protein B n=1 Tax=Rodentibacter heidelbergensis TaxID=1908258 RepID=A0A1V3I717_9PAST|nr:disulfide bond formation protein DsbB [Rodentibacter heidelbergensis]OOF35837.1 disulfide bond formation protein B [Rodentibacter heidelbergensis]